MSGQTTPLIEEHWFDDDGVVPNNPRLPLVVYRGVLESGPGAAGSCETLFAGNGWSGGWRGGVYPYHHYHSTAHEALGIVAGSAKVRLGANSGTVVDLHAADVVVIPAGVAHKGEAQARLSGSTAVRPDREPHHAGNRQSFRWPCHRNIGRARAVGREA